MKTPKLPAKTTGDFFNNRWYFCGTKVREYFDIPADVEAIQFTTHQEPDGDTYAVRFDFNCRSFGAIVFVDLERREYTLSETCRKIHKLLELPKRQPRKPKIYYLKCHYWA